MPRFYSSKCLVALLLCLVVSVGGVAPAGAQDATGGDTTAVTTPNGGDKPGGKLRISIDEGGISIEGKVGGDKKKSVGDGEWVEIRDDRGPYREKGVDIVKFGRSVFVAKDEMVRGDLVVFGGNAIIEGRVTGDVFVVGGNIRLRSGAEIKGDAMVIGGVLDEDEDVIIHGERIRFDDVLPHVGVGTIFGHNTWIRWAVLPVLFFIKLVLALLVLLFLRERVATGDDHLSSGFLKSFGTGVLTCVVGMFALLIVMIPLVITVIGIPLAVLLVVSCIGILIIAWTLFAFSLGKLVAERLNMQSINAFLFVFVGAVVLFLPDFMAILIGVSHTPLLGPVSLSFRVVGVLLGVFAYMAGLGALVLSRFGSRPIAGASPSPPPAGT